ncbi:choice-of-anchor A family protein [Streptomyces noursei]
MRVHATVAVLGMTGAVLLGSGASAFAAPAPVCGEAALGAAGAYAEFVEGDSVRFADSEGAVAVGGDARFGDPTTGQGFSIGDKLTADDLGMLAGKRSMVVGGTLYANQVVINKGSGIYGELKKTGGQFAVDGEHTQGSSPLDFRGEFQKLRARSAGWAATEAKGSVKRSEDSQTLLLTGDDNELNVFAVNAADLQKVSSVAIKVPADATTLVNVVGATYDAGASSLYGIYLWDPQTDKYVLDDYQAGSTQFKELRSKLLWNFPDATSLVKNHTSWPGTILAPKAHVKLGRKDGSGTDVGPGHVNGSVIAQQLTTVPGAETHQMAFAGCLPAQTDQAPPNEPVPPAPAPAPIATPLPELPRPQDPADPGKPSATPSASSTQSGPSFVGDTEPSASPAEEPTPNGSLAATGGGLSPSWIAVGIGAVTAGVGLIAVTLRRRSGARG